MSNRNSPRRIAYMLGQIRKEAINKNVEKPQLHKLHTRGVFGLLDGRGAVMVYGTVYASRELSHLIGDTTWVRVSKKHKWGGVAFDEFNRPFCNLEEVPLANTPYAKEIPF